jgi:hypothetical protein
LVNINCAKVLGANAVLLVTPYYNKPTQEGLYQHYKAIAEAVDIDQILYNVPGRTAVDLLPETAIRLSTINKHRASFVLNPALSGHSQTLNEVDAVEIRSSIGSLEATFQRPQA